jgi:site-specific recombinase XerD
MTKTGSPRRQRLTKRVVDAASPSTGRYIVWDEALAGFGIRVEPTGRKIFVARYRAGGGRHGILRQETLGRYGTLTVDEARKRAKRILGKAAGGGDPLGERKASQQAGATINEVVDWYLREAGAGRLLGRRGRPIKASTVAMDRSRIETHVRPLIGRKAASSLSAGDFEAMQAAIASGCTAKPASQHRARGGIASGGSGVAARTLGMVQAIMEHARRAGIITANPARGTRKMAGSRKTRRLTTAELEKLGAAMRKADEHEVPLAALRFTLLSGFRRNETLGLRGEDIDATGGVSLTDSKSGPQTRPIGHAALEVLRKRAHAIEETGAGGEWLFPAQRGGGHFVGLPKVLARICAKAGLKDVTIHTLRHTFASVAAEIGFSELVIAGLLGHRAGTVTGAYVHLDKVLVAAADQTAAAVAAALDGQKYAKVVHLRQVVG